MKHTLRIPTTEQYAYIEAELDCTPEEAVQTYHNLTNLVKGVPAGLSDAEFRALYDAVASGTPVQGDPGIIEQLSPNQRFALNEAKKFIKRNK
jgi:hypothetical protein